LVYRFELTQKPFRKGVLSYEFFQKAAACGKCSRKTNKKPAEAKMYGLQSLI
jgi:hypothetical protein